MKQGILDEVDVLDEWARGEASDANHWEDISAGDEAKLCRNRQANFEAMARRLRTVAERITEPEDGETRL